MHLELDHVFTSVGVRPFEEEEKRLVDFPLGRLVVIDSQEVRFPRLNTTLFGELQSVLRLVASHTDNRDG